ncbi:MAG: 4Fe-4S dicluster domain-containing protein [Desulfobacteraceae bacterium]|nr:4Fe-4S dicluster domain-containing protein [Desulfobacteraceae bacterium]
MLEIDTSFCDTVVQRSGEEFRRCLQCMSCAGGCPFSHAMTYRPNGVIRLIQYGFVREVLESPDIWLCVGCNTCSIACPMAIDIPGMMDALREIAIENKVKINESAILSFHQEVLNSIQRYGRTHKLEIMMRYKLRRRDFFTDMDVGLKMMAKRKLDLMPSKIADPKVVAKLFSEAEK